VAGSKSRRRLELRRTVKTQTREQCVLASGITHDAPLPVAWHGVKRMETMVFGSRVTLSEHGVLHNHPVNTTQRPPDRIDTASAGRLTLSRCGFPPSEGDCEVAPCSAGLVGRLVITGDLHYIDQHELGVRGMGQLENIGLGGLDVRARLKFDGDGNGPGRKG